MPYSNWRGNIRGDLTLITISVKKMLFIPSENVTNVRRHNTHVNIHKVPILIFENLASVEAEAEMTVALRPFPQQKVHKFLVRKGTKRMVLFVAEIIETNAHIVERRDFCCRQRWTFSKGSTLSKGILKVLQFFEVCLEVPVTVAKSVSIIQKEDSAVRQRSNICR